TAIPVTLKSGDSVLWALVLGNNATNGGRYAKLPDGKDVYVVKTAFWQLIRNNAIDWRDRNILPVSDTDLRSFKLEHVGGSTLSLVKKDEASEWELAEGQSLPPSFRVNKPALGKIVRSATSLRASGFLDEEKEPLSPFVIISAPD